MSAREEQIIQEAALAAGATQLGERPHFLMTAEQLARFVELFQGPPQLPPLRFQMDVRRSLLSNMFKASETEQAQLPPLPY